MTLPLVSAIPGSRCGRQFAAAGLLLVMAVLALAPARADDQQDPYSATVKVDATADSAGSVLLCPTKHPKEVLKKTRNNPMQTSRDEGWKYNNTITFKIHVRLNIV